MRCFCNKWRSSFFFFFYAKGRARTPPGLCVLPRLLHICPPGILLAEDALRTVLNVGLHHSCRFHRGGCNPILFWRSRRAACEEEEGTALRSVALSLPPPPLHSSPFCRVSPSFLPHLFTPLLGEAGRRRRTNLRDRRSIALFTHRPSPRFEVGGAFPPAFCFFPPRFP